MSLDTWPIDILSPKGGRGWYLSNVANPGDTSAEGLNRFAVTDGGGGWMCEMSVDCKTIDKLRVARLMVDRQDGGAGMVIVPDIDVGVAPFPTGGVSGLVPFDDGATFSDTAEFYSVAITASVGAGGAALRATTMALTATAMATLKGGEPFSVVHPTQGKRRYSIVRVNDDGTIEFRPPLREAVSEGDALLFDPKDVGCVMRLVNAKDALAGLNPPFFMTVNLVFQEAFDDVT